MRYCLGVMLLNFGLIAGTANAGDLDDEPFGHRVNLSLDRVTAFSDVIGRQASVAHPLGSSVNPAADDFLREPPVDFQMLVTGTTNQTLFEEGAHVSGASTTSLLRLPERGTFSFTFVRTDTPDGETRMAGPITLRSNEFRPGFAMQLSPDLSIGTEVSIIDGELDVRDTFSGFARQIETDSLGVRWSVGALAALSDKLTVGAVAGIGFDRTESRGQVVVPPPFGPGVVPINVTETMESRVARLGIGYELTEQLALYADAHYLHLQSLNLGSVDLGRFSLGAEVRVTEWLTWRGGATVDTDEEWTLSTNVGLYVFNPLLLEVGYQYNAFPEVEPEFGTAHLISFSAVLLF